MSETKVMEVPEGETGSVPVTISHVEPRLYGVTPATFVLVLAAVAIALAVVFFATGHWPVGLILLGVAVLLVLLFLEAARRRPAGTRSRSTVEALGGFRARAGAAAESLALRGRAARRVLVLRRELHGMASRRERLLFELGEAVYRGDEPAAETARERVEELDRLALQTEAEMQEVVEAARQRVEQRRLEVQPTQVAEAPDEPAAPLPAEGNPPEPARIPEQEPAIIPEPGPRGSGGEEQE